MSEKTNTLDMGLAREYIHFMHIVMIVMLLMLFGLGAGVVYQGTLIQKSNDKALEVIKERDAAILENIQLKEINATSQKKIGKAAEYIHQRYNVPMEVALSYARQEYIESQRTGIPYAVGLAVTSKESSFRTTAVSYTGCCYGLKQVHYRVWSKEKPGLTMNDLNDPYKNIQLGYAILKEYYDKTGSLEGALKRYYGSTDAQENYAYAADVIRRSREIARLLG